MSRVVVITGASRGIGAAFASVFRTNGDVVIGISQSGNTTNTDCVDFLKCDVSNRADVSRYVKLIKKKYGKVDVLICNAAISPVTPLGTDDNRSAWDSVLSTNITGSYEFARSTVPLLVDNTSRIIFLGSVSSFLGSARLSAYSVSKHAIIGLTKSFAKFLAPRKITVNAICPGFVETDMTLDYLQSTGTELQKLLERVPMGRLIAAQEIAEAALFLASPMAGNITGQSLIIDGGLLA